MYRSFKFKTNWRHDPLECTYQRLVLGLGAVHWVDNGAITLLNGHHLSQRFVRNTSSQALADLHRVELGLILGKERRVRHRAS